MDGIRVRTGVPADAELVTFQRAAMFRDMGHGTDATRAEMSERFLPWVRERLGDGTYLAWFAEDADRAVAGLGVWLKPIHPGLRSDRLDVPYVLNVFTEPDYRGKGLARLLMREVLTWARINGHPVVELHASDDGRHLYQTLGFQQTNEMRLISVSGDES